MARYRKTLQTRVRRRRTLDEPLLVGQFHRNRRGEVVRVSLSTYENRNICDVRVYFTGKDGLPLPTKKGVCISVLRIPELLAALTKAQQQSVDLGLVEPEGA